MNDDEVRNNPERKRSYERKLWTVYIGCSLAAAASVGCGIYMLWDTLSAVLTSPGSSNKKAIAILDVICTLDTEANIWLQTSQIMATTFLATLSLGLISTYIVLIYHMRKYFKQQMEAEMCRLTVLFATFVIAYTLRFVYQLGLGHKWYV